MNKTLKRFGALMLTAAMMLAAGCSNTNNNGKEFVNINGTAYYENEMYYNIYYSIGSSYLGIIEYDDTADIATIKKTIGELEQNEDYGDYVKQQKIAFVKQKVCDEKLLNLAKEQGLTLSEEEQQAVDKEYQSVIDFFNSEDTLTQIKEQFFPDSNNADSEAKKYLEKYKKFFLGMYAAKDMDELKVKFNQLGIINKVLKQKADSIPDDEAYIKKYYDEKLAVQKTAFTQDPSAFDDAYDYGDIICYYPSGLRYVKHILIKFSDEDNEKLLEYETKINELETKESRTAQEEQELNDAKTQMNQLTAQMDSNAKAKADEAYGKLQKGEDYETLLNEYGEDASMTDGSSIYAKKGYLIHNSSNMVEEFITTAMKLKNPGDISKPVKSDYGYHIIKYVEKGEEGVVAYEKVRDEILTVAMEEKRQEETTKYYDSLYDEMIASGQVTINYEVLGFDKATYDSLYQEIMNTMSAEE